MNIRAKLHSSSVLGQISSGYWNSMSVAISFISYSALQFFKQPNIHDLIWFLRLFIFSQCRIVISHVSALHMRFEIQCCRLPSGKLFIEVLLISYLCTPFIYLVEVKILMWLKFFPDFRRGKEGDLGCSLKVMSFTLYKSLNLSLFFHP